MVSEKVRAKLEKLIDFVPMSFTTSFGTVVCSVDSRLVDTTSAEPVRLVPERKRFRVTEARTKGTGVLGMPLLNGTIRKEMKLGFRSGRLDR